MKVLWVSASPIGPASRILKLPYAGSSGTWIQTVYEEMTGETDIQLCFLSFMKSVKPGKMLHGSSEEGEAYCLSMPKISLGHRVSAKVQKQVEDVINELKPDIIHIWGTETSVQNAAADCAPNIPKVVFLQGLIGVHDRYHNADLRKIGIRYGRKPFEWAYETLHAKMFHRQIEGEQRELKQCGNVITDNMFSEAYCSSVDGSLRYYQYPFVPNRVFFDVSRVPGQFRKHSVFTVFGSSPDKGLHQLIRALAIVKKSYPDVSLSIPGAYHTDADGHLQNGAKLSAYERLLDRLIRSNDLYDNVRFVGFLSPRQMAEQLACHHLFVNPSVMEVHAGSLREAMTVGTPAISTFCGSVGEFVIEGETGMLYRYEEHEVLAAKIKLLFENNALCEKLSENARMTLRDGSKKDPMSLKQIYDSIIRQAQR